MSVELVTGYYGVGEDGKPKRHVSSAEDGARQAGTVGLGCYALSTGSKLSATMEDANTLVVADGDVMMNGRHVSMPEPTSFTIPTGVQGKKVSNIAVLRYEKAAASVESVTPVVLTGEPSADTPTDPAYNEGSILDGDSPVDMPLYRVVTDGINAGDPVPLFDVMMPMSEFWDSVSQYVDVQFKQSATIANKIVTDTVQLPQIDGWYPFSISNIIIRRPSTDLVSGIILSSGQTAYVSVLSQNSVSGQADSKITVEYRRDTRAEGN